MAPVTTGGGSVVADSLFIVASIVCWGSTFVRCFVVHFIVSFLGLKSC